MAAHNWRGLRLRLADKGFANPMMMPSMHAVLDVIEQMGLESAVHGAKKEIEAKSRIGAFYDKLYAPDPTATVINGDGYQPVPAGFGDDEVEASFDAFMSAVNAGA
ncbi:hypothetical protein I5G59_gp36 [Mycobacterium phage LilMcDreamy]|uniref:Uncharacterized protein n=1 Tax=Mycobacterium phage LilMcDreamy TaxID=2652422 RepID=A0A5P8D6K5_9CAUD|nr:hypothetical protein I5G59_gp36 [Mycobacterium phage LilMcDreamy]QFP94656.1 hypothetical protein SEA_LILMCDREAMY_36 [Mycobacterium phage LilMcDreamy]